MSSGTATEGVWLVLPTLNEAENLVAVVEAAQRSLPASHRILIVDDRSEDGTASIAHRLRERDARIEIVERSERLGLGPAYVDGFSRALRGGAEIIAQMDADRSHDAVDLPRLIAALDQHDLAIGSRYTTGGGIIGWGRGRRALSRLGCLYARRALSVGVRDLTGGFKAYRADALRATDLGSIRSRGYAFQIETTYRVLAANMRVVEVPITFHERAAGRSKMSTSIALEAAVRVPMLRRERARRAATNSAALIDESR